MSDIFQSEIRFFGKHGNHLEALTPGNEAKTNDSLNDIARYKYLFNTVIDIYIVAPLIGLLYGRYEDQDGNTETKSIFAETVIRYQKKLFFSYELVMILDREGEPDINERIRRAFRANDELTSLGIERFNGYARGGIEVLYEELIQGAATPDDLVRNLMDFTEDYHERYNIVLDDDDAIYDYIDKHWN